VHNSYFVLRELGIRLNDILAGTKVYSCYSQDKDELVLQFMTDQEEYYLHAILRSNFSMIRFPESLSRARKNSIALFEELKDCEVRKVYCVENERCLCILLERNLSILFKMFGHQSNILTCRDGVPFKIFKHKLKDDLHLSLDNLGSKININRESLLQHDWDFTKLWPALGGKVKKHLMKLGYSRLEPEGKLKLLEKVQQQLIDPEFFIYREDELPVLTLFKPDHPILQSKDVILALNEFFLHYVRDEQFRALKKSITANLEKQKRRAEGTVRKSQQRLAHLKKSTSYREMADIIMANLYQIPPNASEVQLPDFSTGKLIPIRLKPTLSPQKNAEQFYRKSKNQSKEITVLQQNLELNQSKANFLRTHLDYIRDCQQLKMLKQYAHEHDLISTKSRADSQSPFREFRFGGFRILIGRNAANNDLLTQKYAHKDDLWLHAKDVKGSHVVVKQKPGQAFPQPVIEKAAQLAAYYSKRKHDSLCPVAYTPKKYVRKRKGAAPGEVIVEREQVILVTPETPSFSH
jgi:predicted ribosome quality control (RQC) complex YloA/Tae2 family protein